MDIGTIAQFALATLLPVAACIVLTLLRMHTSVARVPEKGWQVIVGVVFGLIAIYGTEAGIPMDGAMMNVRDAAPLAAGLFFGGPAGIIAGLIGGIERWLAVMWGVGEFTRVACSLGTIFAGAYAASDGTYSTWGNTGAKSANRVQFYNFGETHFTSNFGMFHVIAATRASGYDSNLTNKKNDRAFQFVVRPYYQLTKMSRVLVEAGFYTSVDKFELPDGTVEKNVKQAQKFTLAYALTPDASNFWSRPEIRFYTTYIHTNGGIDVSEWGKANKKNAFLVGAQVEAWF